jgi:phage terminase Nu1 subunit (DNA packaging protein)
MAKKSDRVTELPGGLIPLLTMPQLETLYGVSDWQVLKWIRDGMPVEPFAGRQRRFDLAKVRAWMADQDTQAPASEPQLIAASA